MKCDVIDVSVCVHHRTEKAVLVSDDGDRDKAKWLPLSRVEIEMDGESAGIVTLPEWLAVEKGLV